ncbi:unnamed protein product [Microthlaspi erraticum]|uniref:Uncharacterized protein n=1 Tax=Microthlaspi erraticum TaxID=1685480 RepID=A0A6D2JFJ3_9BRAS|nr:unnamed protein product [Microthlaspi erraticum]
MALRGEEFDFNLREWGRKGHITRGNSSCRRLSGSYIRSFREDHKSCRTTVTISSTASSPGYSLAEEIDPSNYSFTSALKGLQDKKNWNWLKPEGVELHSKWNEAEKYICNPLSGEVPMECLSSKTLNSRSFSNLSTMSTPVMSLPSNRNLNNPRTISTNVRVLHKDPISPDHVFIKEKKVVRLKDVGVQSAPVNVSRRANIPPPIMEKSTKIQVEAADSPYALKLKAQQEAVVKMEEEKQNMMTKENQEEKKKKRGNGLFSWMRKGQRQPTKSKCIFLICVPRLVNAF